MKDRMMTLAVDDATEWSLLQGLSFKASRDTAVHTPFSFTPSTIDKGRFDSLTSTTPLMGRLVHSVSEDVLFIENAIAPVADADPFFNALLSMHRQINSKKDKPKRLPLLIMRSDFMDNVDSGPKLIEFNGIAAGMGPFGQKISELHRYLRNQWPEVYSLWSDTSHGAGIVNPAIDRLANGIAQATLQIKHEFENDGSDNTDERSPATFLMIVQSHEDNVFDQHLLTHALQSRGIKTIRRTFRQLHGQLYSGKGDRLMLNEVGPIDTVYLRAGYEYCDYAAVDIEGQACCEALMQTRLFIEQHRVSMNATVGQQLATSKRVQMLLTAMSPQALTGFGLTLAEAESVKSLMGEMVEVNANSASWFAKQSSADWVLKNQGEGGGHCIFDLDIAPKLLSLSSDEYQAWSLMRRLHPTPRETPALLIRKGSGSVVKDLISEIGIFSLHINGEPIEEQAGYCGYLIRSKSASETEGGIHSGMGVLDSLVYKNEPL